MFAEIALSTTISHLLGSTDTCFFFPCIFQFIKIYCILTKAGKTFCEPWYSKTSEGSMSNSSFFSKLYQYVP